MIGIDSTSLYKKMSFYYLIHNLDVMIFLIEKRGESILVIEENLLISTMLSVALIVSRT